MFHRVSFQSNASLQSEFKRLGFQIPERGLATLMVSEEHSAWASVDEIQRGLHAVDAVETKFLEADLEAADWLEILPEWQCGYPGPRSDEFGYKQHTYDLSDYCPDCGIGLEQRRAFAFEREPKWGSQSLLQLNWIFDEIFATPELWRSVFEPLGVQAIPVENTVGGTLDSVVQLAISGRIGLKVVPQERTICLTCRRSKSPIQREVVSQQSAARNPVSYSRLINTLGPKRWPIGPSLDLRPFFKPCDPLE